MKINKSIIDGLNNNPKIKRYKVLEKVVNKDKNLKDNINKLKNIQKEIVHAKEFGKEAFLDKLNKDYDELYDEIRNYPLMSEYIDLQNEINNMIQNFIDIVENGIDKDLNTQ